MYRKIAFMSTEKDICIRSVCSSQHSLPLSRLCSLALHMHLQTQLSNIHHRFHIHHEVAVSEHWHTTLLCHVYKTVYSTHSALLSSHFPLTDIQIIAPAAISLSLSLFPHLKCKVVSHSILKSSCRRASITNRHQLLYTFESR